MEACAEKIYQRQVTKLGLSDCANQLSILGDARELTSNCSADGLGGERRWREVEVRLIHAQGGMYSITAALLATDNDCSCATCSLST